MSVHPRQASFQSDGISRDRRSVGRRVCALTYGFVIIATVGAALAWQSSDDKTRDTIRAWGTSLIQLLSMLGTKSPAGSDAAIEPASKTSEQASVAATSSHDLQHQLETMVSDLAVTRYMVEQVAAKQEQMTKTSQRFGRPSRILAKGYRRYLNPQRCRRAKMRKGLWIRSASAATLSAYPDPSPAKTVALALTISPIVSSPTTFAASTRHYGLPPRWPLA